MTVSVGAIKALRDKTGASLKDVREALERAHGDEAKAIEHLRERGAQIAEKRQAKAAGGSGQGRVDAYLHHDGKLGALVEVQCETDFVARTQDFIQFCRDVAMQVAAMSPQYIRRDDTPKDLKVSEDDLKATCLLEQPFVKDQQTTVGDMLKLLVAKTGEHLAIRRFVRFVTGQPPTITP